MEDKCKYKYRKLKDKIKEVEVQVQQQAELQAQLQAQLIAQQTQTQSLAQTLAQTQSLAQTLAQNQAQTQAANQAANQATNQAQTQAQNHNTAQETAQAQNDTDTISNVGNPTLSNIGNPVINVNVGDTTASNLVVASAFRAASAANLPVPASTNVKVLFANEQFDLANEYNPVTSIFTPKQNGVYLVSGTVSFVPDNATVNYTVFVAIRVNGGPFVALDNDFFGPSSSSNVVTVSTILNLKAGDQVDIIVNSSIAGVVVADVPGGQSTHFEAARFPSPLS